MRVVLGIALGALLAAGVAAQDMRGHDMAGMAHPQAGGDGALRETGQSAFAAIAEATAALEADPNTDWSRVDVEALRDHLVDMDNVTMRSNVVSQPVPGGARFEVASNDPRVRPSIARMIRMHAAMANGEGRDQAIVTTIPGGVAMTVTGAKAGD